LKAYLEPEEVSALEKAATNLRDRLLIRVLFHLGCRVSEEIAVAVEDVDLVRGTITILHLKRRVKLLCANCGAQLGATHLFCPKCGNPVDKSKTEEREHRRQRTLPIDGETLDLLKEYISRSGPVVKNGRKMVFGINRHRAWQIVTECADRAGLPKLVNPETGKVHNVSPHKLRDAFATHAIKTNDTGDGLRLLQVHLGHASFNTTAKYRKVAGDELKDWYEKLWQEGKS
jgi:integrase/recombinase XerD